MNDLPQIGEDRENFIKEWQTTLGMNDNCYVFSAETIPYPQTKSWITKQPRTVGSLQRRLYPESYSSP